MRQLWMICTLAIVGLNVPQSAAGNCGSQLGKINGTTVNTKTVGVGNCSTKLGHIIGTTVDTVDGYKVNVFRGIPYAKSPIGERRFAKPEPHGSWNETLHATEFGSKCMQLGYYQVVGKEDCLTLNIYAPQQIANTRLSVMVYIHGGSFLSGAGSDLEGHILAAKGNVIVVTINYRLNVFGFLATGSKIIPGNWGLWDQHLALLWVHNNIDDFGGNNLDITIFGESAGGRSVNFQMFSPHNNNTIFQRAITQSGSALSLTYINRNPMEVTRNTSKAVGCNHEDDTKLLECLRDKSAKELELATASANRYFPYFPITDGDFLPTDLGYLMANYTKFGVAEVKEKLGDFLQYDYMAGWNSQDGLLYMSRLEHMNKVMTGQNLSQGITEDVFNQAITAWPFVNFANQQDTKMYVDMITNFYRTSSKSTAISSKRSVSDQRVELYSRISGETVLMIPSIESAILHTDGSNKTTYVYEYDHRRSTPSELIWYEGPNWLRTGADHTDDLPILFGYPFMSDETKIPYSKNETVSSFTEEEKKLSQDMITYWSNFAKSGNPDQSMNVSRVWPSFNSQQKYVCIQTNQSEVKSFPLDDSVRFWRALKVAATERHTVSNNNIATITVNNTNITGRYLSGAMELTHKEANQALTTVVVVSVLLVVILLILIALYIKQRIVLLGNKHMMKGD